MGLVGVVCQMDQTYQPFDVCIGCHDSNSKERNCHAPTALLKSMRDNHLTRKNAGVSATTILSCAKALALMELYDFYEPVISGYNKFRGTLIHYLLEEDDPPDGVIQERRVERFVNIDGAPFRVSGKMDRVDTRFNFLLDYKSCPNIPTKPKKSHEVQLNIYRWLLANGIFCDTGEQAQIEIEAVGIHYLTFHTKPDKAWKKMGYPTWDLQDTEDFIIERARPIQQWQLNHVMPECNMFEPSPYWLCDCAKHENQLADRGISIG